MTRRPPGRAAPNRVWIDAAKGGAGADVLGRRLVRRARRFLLALKLQGVELSLSLVRDAAMQRLNKQWRGKDTATDVLSFPSGEAVGPGPTPLGDIVISTQTARRAARDLGTSVEAEVELYLAHGLLHLLGFDHLTPKDAKAMAEAERRLLGEGGMLSRSDEG